MKNKVSVFLIGVVIIVAIAGYAAYQLNLSIKEKKILKTQLEKILKQREQLQSRLKEARDIVSPLKEENIGLKKSLEKKEKQEIKLKEQATQAQTDAQNFKEKLIETKTGIKELKKELKQVLFEKQSLEKKDLKINRSLENTTKKLMRSQKNLKLLKQKLSRIKSREISPLKRESVRLAKSLKAKDNEFAILEWQLEDVTEKYITLGSANKFLEKQIEQLDTERFSLQGQIDKADEQLSRESELANLTKANQKEKLRQQKLHLEKIDARYNEQKLRISQFTNILVQKELELDVGQKKISSLKDEISNLQSKLAALEMELSAAGEHQKKIIGYFSDLTDLNTALQGRLNELSNVLSEESLDKEKAEELKHKIEVILEPIEAEREQ